MNIPKEIIELAIGGGWEPLEADTHSRFKWRPETSVYRFWYKELLTKGEWFADFSKAEIALDPTFWKALGKACGWWQKTAKEGDVKWSIMNEKQKEHYLTPLVNEKAHRFYDLILTGASTEEFWATLLK